MATRVRTLCAIACATIAVAVPARARAASCSFSSSGIAFGVYDPMSATAVQGRGSIDYHCSPGEGAIITINGGSANNVNARRMVSGPERLAYSVFKYANFSGVWGDDLGTGLLTGLDKRGSVPVYGSIPPRQDVAAGNYIDTLTVTIVFW
jgi:spore coat protein U-like protein